MVRHLTCLFLLAFLGVCHADGSVPTAEETREPRSVLSGPIRLYRTILSPADGDRCPMAPSCSAYAEQAVQRHGIMMGWIMACDRLLRCGRDECRRGLTKKTPNGTRCADTVENNDFWWY